MIARPSKNKKKQAQGTRRTNQRPRNRAKALNNHQPRVLFFDIESTAALGYVYQKYDARVLAVKRPWHLLSFSYSWLGEKKYITCLCRSFRTRTKKPHTTIGISPWLSMTYPVRPRTCVRLMVKILM
jgi:hypothetical protein